MASQIRVILEGVCDHTEELLDILELRVTVCDIFVLGGLEEGWLDKGGLEVGTGVERADLVGEAVGSGNVEGWLRVETMIYHNAQVQSFGYVADVSRTWVNLVRRSHQRLDSRDGDTPSENCLVIPFL